MNFAVSTGDDNKQKKLYRGPVQDCPLGRLSYPGALSKSCARHKFKIASDVSESPIGYRSVAPSKPRQLSMQSETCRIQGTVRRTQRQNNAVLILNWLLINWSCNSDPARPEK